MNKSRFNRITLGSTLLAVLVTVGAASVAFAQNTPAPGAPGACEGHRGGHGGRGGRGHGPMDPAAFTRFMDRNGDGRVEVSELPPRAQTRMAAADTNRDGVLSAQEITAHMEAQRAVRFARMDSNSDGAVTADEVGPRWEHLQAADADHNGRVSRDELQAAHASGALRGGHGHGRGRGEGGPRDGAGFVQRFDRNGNGSIEVSELPPRMAEHLGAADTNRDGTLSADELRIHREQRRAAREAGERGPQAPRKH
ncbi:MAG: hypothetical protein KA978_27485 [Deltaproteobacteria bacterium]|nr:hypothetical protein [Deltaproteobacteria bacterium]